MNPLKPHPILFSLLAIFSLLSCTKKIAPQKWQLAWEENFNSDKPDLTKWSKIPRGKSDWNKYMSNYDSCYDFRNGKLILRGIKNTKLSNDTATYLTGGVYGKDKKAFGFGRLEIRAKLNGAKGAWPAFWMLPQNGTWPGDGEIDIMERLSYDALVYQTVHSYYTYTLKIKDPKQSSTIAINPNDFNIYAVERYADSVVFYVNDQRNFSYPKINTGKQSQFPFDKHDYYLLLDMQLGGSWVGAVDPNDIPVEMEIDWVKFYIKKD